MIIYKITNAINNKIYIGQTISTLNNRANKHKNESISGRKKNYFNLAIVKHGFDNFVFEEIDSADSQEELDYMEVYWIKFFNSNNRTYGYNLANGGRVNRGFKKTDDQKRKISECVKKLWQRNEHREKIAKTVNEGYRNNRITPHNKGKTLSEITKNKISIANKGKIPPNKGKTHSPQTKQKISESKIGKPSGAKGKKWNQKSVQAICKKIRCIETEKIYESVELAAQEFGLYPGNLSSTLTGKQKTFAGLNWEYVKENE